MANGMIDPMMAGNAGLDRMPVSAEPPPMGGGNDEVSQLLFLREQIDARLAELGAGAPTEKAVMPPMDPIQGVMPSAPAMGAAPAGLLGAGPY